jgi:hypothetical protein
MPFQNTVVAYVASSEALPPSTSALEVQLSRGFSDKGPGLGPNTKPSLIYCHVLGSSLTDSVCEMNVATSTLQPGIIVGSVEGRFSGPPVT